MRLALRVIVVLAVLGIALAVSDYVYRRSHTQSIASEMIQELCRDQGYDPTKLSGPVDGRMGNCPASYSWTYRDSVHNLELLVSFDYSYDAKITKWDNDRK